MAKKIVLDPNDAEIGDYTYRNTGEEPTDQQGIHSWDMFHSVNTTTGEWFVLTLGGQTWVLVRVHNLWLRIE